MELSVFQGAVRRVAPGFDLVPDFHLLAAHVRASFMSRFFQHIVPIAMQQTNESGSTGLLSGFDVEKSNIIKK